MTAVGQSTQSLQERLNTARSRRQQSAQLDDSDDEIEVKEVWSSKGTLHRQQSPSPAQAEVQGNGKTRSEGNRAFAARHFAEAARLYSAALQLCDNGDTEEQAALLNNRARAHLKLGKPLEAEADAVAAAQLLPAWPKPRYTLAQAYMSISDHHAAVQACRQGEALYDSKSNLTNDFSQLLDTIAMSAALSGDLSGFDGRHLEVRSAGEEAWLGQAAPEDPKLDAEPGATSLQALAGSSSGSSSKALVVLPSSHGALSSAAGRQRYSFRSLKEAVEAARDGDRILLLKGIHNGLGETVNISKRILIHGEGLLGETRFDHRANSPAFRISRVCILHSIDVDMTGFCQAVLVTGAAVVRPILQNCIVRCSGDDAININGNAQPTIRGCTLQARKCGVRAFGSAGGLCEGCTIEDCGEPGIQAMDVASVCLNRCHVRNGKEEAVLAMDRACVQLHACQLSGCRGPGVDISHSACVKMQDCNVHNNVGALWMWDASKALVESSVLSGGESFAVVVDGTAKPLLKVLERTLKQFADLTPFPAVAITSTKSFSVVVVESLNANVEYSLAAGIASTVNGGRASAYVYSAYASLLRAYDSLLRAQAGQMPSPFGDLKKSHLCKTVYVHRRKHSKLDQQV